MRDIATKEEVGVDKDFVSYYEQDARRVVKAILAEVKASKISLCCLGLFSNEKISKRGDELLKRKTTGVNLEDSTLIPQLFTIYLGGD